MNATLERISAITRQRCVADGYSLERVEELARQYLDVFQNQGYVGLTCREALEQPDYLWCSFFASLKDRRGAGDRPRSPVEENSDSTWMQDYDFCFLNVRATALSPGSTGSFLQAVKLLPILRTKGIHLAPFLDCNFGNVYCVDSLRMPYPKTLDEELLAEGIGPDDQVRFFVDMAHLADMVVGFDLEPHTSQFSRVVLAHPSLFRWVRLNAKKTALEPKGMAITLKAKNQRSIVEEVRQVVQAAFAKEGLSKVEPEDGDRSAIGRAHKAALEELIKRGIWTLPSHTWGGVGLPDYKSYNKKDNYPVFDYRNEDGEDHAVHAFGMLTPFRFYDDLPINKLPTKKHKPKVNDEVVDHFAEIFPEVQERYGFDFVRVDYVDHVFDSVMEDDETLPISDRCIPSVLERVIQRARRDKPYIGAMAERMGMDIEEYGSIGFDVLLGCEILSPVHGELVSGNLMWSRESYEMSLEAERLATVPWAVDTHDSGNPLFWTKSLSEVIGSPGLILRQFVSRFATPGPVRRPKYECIGNQDLSHGLFYTNNNDKSLTWVGDRNHCRLYHAVEDAYRRFERLIRDGAASWWTVEETWAAWCLDTAPGADGWRGRLICFVALERPVKKLQDAVADVEPLPVVPSIELDASKDWDRHPREVHEVLLDGSGYERPIPLVNGRCFRTGGLPPRGCKLFLVRG